MPRYDQCDHTCTVDCGHCKGQGPPRNLEPRVAPNPFPIIEVTQAEIDAEIEDWWAAGEAERSADRLVYGDVDSTCVETGRAELP